MTTPQKLWSAPESVLDRSNITARDTEWTDFLLCGLYCLVAVLFLLIFGIAAIIRGEIPYAVVILGFAVATCLIYGSIWLSGKYFMARHFVVALMGILCLFLFYSGGTGNTGPLYYFIFPIVALFLQGIRLGSISVVSLLLISLLILETGALGFDTQRYSFVFISRVLTIYVIVSILSFLFAFFREKAERELLLSQEDLESISHADFLTGLATRHFMERLIALEFNRFKRYNTSFCLLAMRVDKFDPLRRKYGTQYANSVLFGVAQQLMGSLRNVDITARWEDDELMIMLPEATLESARLTAERLRREIRTQPFPAGPITVSIGISQINNSPREAITLAGNNLYLATQGEGDSVITGRQPVRRNKAHGLSASYDKPE